MKEILTDTNMLWKALVFVLCLCAFVQGLRIGWLEKRIDKLQESFLKVSWENVKALVKLQSQTVPVKVEDTENDQDVPEEKKNDS